MPTPRSTRQTVAAAAPTPPSLVTTTGAADYLNSSPRTLEDWRLNGIGPAYIKVGQSVRYRLADLDAWIAANTVTPENGR